MALTSWQGTAGSVPVVGLDEPLALDVRAAGAKAANLAKAARVGLPVLPGFVIPIQACAELDPASWAPAGADQPGLRRAWYQLSAGGTRSLVVRSSSSTEDTESSSMAGVFTSVLDVHSWDDFCRAVAEVIASAASAPTDEPAPMAVLVQPQLDAAWGGVMFGADPLSGRTDRLLVSAVAAGPDVLVKGEADGVQHVLSRRGRLLERKGDDGVLPRQQRWALARLAARTARAFGGHQDMEWAFDREGHLWLLQSRPITAMAATVDPKSPVLGPGPVAETLPDRLFPLEEDLWAPPLREALAEAVVLSGGAPRRKVAASPVLVTVQGRIAVDLGLLGALPRRRSLVAALDPRPKARRLAAAWRVGRLRAAMPALAEDLLRRVDADLAAVPPLVEVDDETLLGVLHRSRRVLVALHGHEVLAGMISPDETGTSSAGAALATLAAGREAGLSDEEILRAEPIVLALAPPAVTASPALPPIVVDLGGPPGPLPTREALRVRARWVQELGARAAYELGARLTRRGLLSEPARVRELRLVQVEDLIRQGGDAAAAFLRPAGTAVETSAPLPAYFRLTADGDPVAVQRRCQPADGGLGVASGRGVGRVHQGAGQPEPGDVLVVRTLDPGLAAVLPLLGGLVAETGSALSHLAILARELGVPAVVGVADATERFPAGSTVSVDGGTGEVALQEPAGRAS